MVNILVFTISLLFLITGTSTVQHQIQKRQANSNYSEYSYNPASPNGPAQWQEVFAAACGGKSQSPINIQTSKTKKVDNLRYKSTKWAERPTEITVQNDGHTVVFRFKYADQTLPNIYSRGNVYEFEQLHFHFGLTRTAGTEHYINNRALSMEGHAVFFNLKYETFDNALGYRDGLVVFARFYNESDCCSPVGVDFEFLQSVRNPNDVYSIDQELSVFSLQDIMGPLKCPCYKYNGSLTTPDCNEVVSWYIAANSLAISTGNLTYFRQLMGYEGLMAPNIRPLQKLNGRTVYYQKSSKS